MAHLKFNLDVFFDTVRDNPFLGSLSQDQVDGMFAILNEWEKHHSKDDLRWLAYMFATTFHETAQEMQPIEEYGKGSGQPYGKIDPETGQAYYGRGFVQLTWRDNYARADRELHLTDKKSCEWNADNALDLEIATNVMFIGMIEGWFRTHDDGDPENLPRYFNEDRDDPYEAREIINGDKHYIPSWSNGVKIGQVIASYHYSFLEALQMAVGSVPEVEELVVKVTIVAPRGVTVEVDVQED